MIEETNLEWLMRLDRLWEMNSKTLLLKKERA